MYDILIKHGTIVDGTGNKKFTGDIAVKDGKIVKIQDSIDAQSKKIIDAENKIVSPGFIDIHSHSDLRAASCNLCDIKIQQGVTTEIYGNCGFSIAPINNKTLNLLNEYSSPFLGTFDIPFTWNSYDEYIDMLKNKKYMHNIGGLVGNSSLRIALKGFDKENLTKEDIKKMRSSLLEAINSGALGLSLGLMYMPDTLHTTDELVNIISCLKNYNTVVTAHIRGEGNSLVSSVKEIIEIGKKTGVPVNISHFKCAGKNNWGTAIDEAIDLIETARSKGQDVTCDVYPYTAGSTTLSSVMPPWAVEGGVDQFLNRLKNTITRNKIKDELAKDTSDWDNLVYSTGWNSVVIVDVNTPKNKYCIGKSIEEIAKIRGEEPDECAINLLIEENGKVSMVFFHMSEEDVKKIISLDYSFIISDSIYLNEGNPHPRLYGTYPRLFSKYVREEPILTIEKAVQKCTYLPAKRINLNDRGLLREGYQADIVIFDINKIKDKATYENPRQNCEGIDYVIVNGITSLENGKVLDNKNGKLLLSEYAHTTI
ncbi:aminoacylase [Vallitalea longa]|uniref:Aminoacylase n=1 Tax=Vallitalea longa TaxID=2936439 RepID=A0A9W6DGF6_9FIRM|nr:D-aminoacylase [Vallitalea longa]GKX32251.1 aminoacylase [Vallitalea longa]